MRHPVFSKFKQFQIEQVNPDFQVNFLGVVTRKAFDAGVAAALGLQFTDLPRGAYAPYPGLNEEYPEWIDILESVIAADEEFTMIELGAGYGRWLVNAALAMKQYHGNLPMKLIGVEAEPTHFQWMKQHFQDNNLDLENHEFIEAAVDEKEGEVYFYTGKADEWYGQSIAQGANSTSELVQAVKAVSLSQILSTIEQVDLIDLDIQGAELIVLKSAIQELNQKVKRIHIGTHGHEIEQGLRELFRKHGWYKYNDYSCQTCELTEWGEINFGDGVQTWINPQLSPVQPTMDELNRLQGIIDRLANSKYQLRQELEQKNTQLQHTQSDLERLQAQLARSQSQLQPSESDLERLQAQLMRSQSQLQNTQSELEQLGILVAAMKSSKFWKLRTAWFNLKRAVGLGKEN